MLAFKEIAVLVSGNILSFHEEYPLQYLLIDSRRLVSSASSLFFAIKGPRHDGHQFVRDVYAKGVRQFIVETSARISATDYPESNIVEVDNAVEALQRVAEHHRLQYAMPVLAIAGSNGKTIVKEWLAQLLSRDLAIVKNPKSYNSQVGVPLSVWEMSEAHNFGIFEAGISQPGEMEKLESVIHPSLGLFTNVGPAHDEGFENRQQKIREKLKLFQHIETLFYCGDHACIEAGINESGLTFSTFTWSLHKKSADVYVRKVVKSQDSARIHLVHKKEKMIFWSPFADEASLENIIHCISFLLHRKVDFTEIQKRIKLLHPVAMRLELKKGINGCSIIDDAYSNDLAGLSIALNFLEQQHQKQTKTVILSDVLEAGQETSALYAAIAGMVRDHGVQKMIGIGPSIKKYAGLFLGGDFYEDTEEFINRVDLSLFKEETILIKGARVFMFEKIASMFQEKVHGTVLHVNLDALSHNLNFYRSQLQPSTKIMVMVKAFAYGSGSYEVANLLQFHRVDYLGVAYVDEGVGLRENGINLPVMVMNPSPEGFSKLIEHKLEPEIYSFKILNDFLHYLSAHQVSCKAHLKIDTGMRRLGFEAQDVPELLSLLKSAPGLEVASIFTHLAGADESLHNEFSIKQLDVFQKVSAEIEFGIGYSVLKHGLNSAGILRFPDRQMDMVRLGIGLYGVETNKSRQHELQEVGTLKTIISQIKKVKAGETVGYSRRGVLEKDSEIATIAIGYADGYSRRFGNGVGKVFVKGNFCSTVGSVCMDMSMIDITGSGAQEGDEVVVFGKEISVSDMAATIGTIPYEVLTGISERVKRVFYTE